MWRIQIENLVNLNIQNKEQNVSYRWFIQKLLIWHTARHIKVFLLVTKHKPEAIEQQEELQNDGSLSLVAPWSFKRRKTR